MQALIDELAQYFYKSNKFLTLICHGCFHSLLFRLLILFPLREALSTDVVFCLMKWQCSTMSTSNAAIVGKIICYTRTGRLFPCFFYLKKTSVFFFCGKNKDRYAITKSKAPKIVETVWSSWAGRVVEEEKKEGQGPGAEGFLWIQFTCSFRAHWMIMEGKNSSSTML